MTDGKGTSAAETLRDPFTKLALLMMDKAIDGKLVDFLRLGTKCSSELGIALSKDRRHSYEVRCRKRFRRHKDVVVLLCGGVLAVLWHRALEGGSHATVHVCHGRTNPDPRSVRVLASMLRECGLKAAVQAHRSDASELFIRF